MNSLGGIVIQCKKDVTQIEWILLELLLSIKDCIIKSVEHL